MSRRSLGVVVTTLAGALIAGCGGEDSVPRMPGEPQPKVAAGPAPPGAITFSGWHWFVKSSDEPVGPGPNRYGDAAAGNVELDEQGRLHLRVTRREGRWYSAEVIGTESMGYGTYTWVIDEPATPDEPNSVLGLFTWSDDSVQHHREIDVELSQFRRPDGDVAGQFVVQPFERVDNVRQFARTTTGPLTVSFTWKPDKVSFTSDGTDPADWAYAGADVPEPGGEVHPRMNLWLLAGDPPAGGKQTEVVVRSFTFVPLG